MPQPREFNRRNVWDRYELDEHFGKLPHRSTAAVEFAV